MNLVSERKWTTLLFNPFAYIAGSEALGIGIVVLVLGGLLGALAHTHFDGVLDIHTGASAPLWLFFSESFIDWLSLALVLWLFGRLVSKTSFRPVDLFGTQAMARWLMIPTALLTLLPPYPRFTGELVNSMLKGDLVNSVLKPGAHVSFNPLDAAYFAFASVVILALIVWMVALMWKSYSVSCNVRGGKAVGSFILGILIAEALSKVVIISLFKLI